MNRSRIIWVLLQLSCCLLVSARTSSTHLALRLPRGGSELYEINPDYVPPPSSRRPASLGDLENSPSRHQYYTETSRPYARRSSLGQFMAYTTQLHRISPTLSVGSASCILIWLLWQIPQAQRYLQRYFVCSRYNVLHGRQWTTLTSAVSHASFTHLLVNLFAFLSFGPSLVQTLSSSNWKLWPLVVGAALFSSNVFLVCSKRGGGCMGLSGVTLAFLAFTARLHPKRELGVLLMGIVPVRMPAETMLYVLLAWSVAGTFVETKSGVAHSAHVGGLLFGMGYYELWKRRSLLRQMRRTITRR